jgi:hypothetical protein
MDKSQRKNALKRWKQADHTQAIAAMPLSPEQLRRLLDYLDASLRSCDHTTRHTTIFLDAENLEREKVLSWLCEQSGFCDCEVLANLADPDELLQKPASTPRVPAQQNLNRVPRKLENVVGWSLSNLQAPWRIANLYTPTEPIRIGLGKKSGCFLTIVETPLPAGDHASDEFWSRLWYERTGLPRKGTLQVTRGILDIPDRFRSILVQSPGWTPVYGWVIPETESWHLEIQTESNRCAGDLPQIATLISQLSCGQV